MQIADKVFVAGIDEAGRGPLAGPVVAAAVILDDLNMPEGMRDSKRLTEKRREVLAEQIWETAVAVGVGIVHEQDIDRINILQATFKAMRAAIAQLSPKPARALVDGKIAIPGISMDQETIVGGDDLIPAISAASIIAKTTRDRMMKSYDILFPAYGFKSHKGYGSAKHREILEKEGFCPIHRRTFNPVTQCENKHYKYSGLEHAYGRMGEIIAGMHLIRNGFDLLEHSYHAGRNGEIDLIARKDHEMVFVEVKSYGLGGDDDLALERVTQTKQLQIGRIAEQYLERREFPDSDCRFDIITVNFHGRKPIIKHYEDAFLPF